ncbi:class I SAM-dependent methyltransferase [Streptacidiphilus monticola]|uniref:Class I SAM-dependent methyltransferase n=1 Tax=Streptacidiphilus monticola TaxID=2161674 RepID=A0ABW1FU07_9ACTN
MSARVGEAYDGIAQLYAELFAGELAERPLEYALVRDFAARAAGLGLPVLDAGCGPGHVTAVLAAAGLDAFGVDLSPRMVQLARERHPELRYEVGSLLRLAGVPDASIGGVLARYSLIHLTPEQLPAALGEFRRVLAPGGYLFVAGMAGESPVAAYDHKVAPAYRWSLDRILDELAAAGFTPRLRLLRDPETHERTPHLAVIAQAGVQPAAAQAGA